LVKSNRIIALNFKNPELASGFFMLMICLTMYKFQQDYSILAMLYAKFALGCGAMSD